MNNLILQGFVAVILIPVILIAEDTVPLDETLRRIDGIENHLAILGNRKSTQSVVLVVLSRRGRATAEERNGQSITAQPLIINALTMALALTQAGWLILILLIAQTGSGEASRSTPAAEAQKIRSAFGEGGDTAYRIYAARVGTCRDARRGLFIADRSLPKRIEVAFAFWILVGGGRVILVDTGFVNQAMIARWHIEAYRDPTAILQDVGFRADQVTDVIVTHGHWDHVGGVGRFKDARIWIGKQAFGGWGENSGGWLTRVLRRAKQQGRLMITAAIQRVAPSVVVVPVGLHAPGFQYVAVNAGDGIWVLASDIAPLWTNFERRKVTGQTSDPKRTLAVQDTMMALVDGDLSHIIPGHEPRIFKSNPRGIVELNGAGTQPDENTRGAEQAEPLPPKRQATQGADPSNLRSK